MVDACVDGGCVCLWWFHVLMVDACVDDGFVY